MFGQWMKRSLHARFGQALDEELPDALLQILDAGHAGNDKPDPDGH